MSISTQTLHVCLKLILMSAFVSSDLKDLSVEELTGTFETFSPILRKMFNDNKSVSSPIL